MSDNIAVSMLQLSGVSVSYADGTRALDDVSLSVPQGQFCVLLGPSGAGKSTLLKAINGLVIPDQGEIHIAGRIHHGSGRFPVATIHQSIDLVLRASVLDNVLHGALSEVSAVAAMFGWFGRQREREACALLERVGLSEAHLYRRAAELSGGQQQRVGVARAFMKQPQVVLADEPVASLDPRTSRDILQLLREAARERNVTVLCSLHDVGLAHEFADRIVAMRAGRIVFDGQPCTLDEMSVQRLYATAA